MAKVLLVEDDNNLREIYEARLNAEGYEIITAQNGEEALSAAKQNKPDLVISDVMMPRISGFEMLDILRNTDELKNTKVIMLTALGQAEDRNRADNLGADKYLVKSQVTLEDIVNAAKELLADEPGQVTMPTVSMPAAPAPEPVAVAQTAVSVMPAQDAPAVTPVATAPIDVPEPVMPEPVATMPVNPEPAAEPVEPVTQAVPEFTAQPTAIPDPAPSYASTTVTVADPDPITQRITPTTDTAEPEQAPMATPQVIAPEPVMPEPVATTPVNPEPAAEPIAQPETATATEQTSEPQTLADEEAAIQAQIASFAASDQPPAPEVAPNTNDAILDDAINKLTAAPGVTLPSVEQPETAPVSEPIDEPTEQPSESATTEAAVDTTSQIVGRKVIQPPSESETGTTNLDILVAQEEAKEAAAAQTNPQPIVVSQTPASPPTGFDPNSIAL